MVDELKRLITAFEKIQRTYASYGAYDTEPDGVFQVQLVRATLGKSVNIPHNGGGWQLYRGKKGIRLVAKQLHDACEAVVAFIQKAPNKERDAIRAYLKDYCWRVTWNA